MNPFTPIMINRKTAKALRKIYGEGVTYDYTIRNLIIEHYQTKRDKNE